MIKKLAKEVKMKMIKKIKIKMTVMINLLKITIKLMKNLRRKII
jgi:hypothetical protein